MGMRKFAKGGIIGGEKPIPLPLPLDPGETIIPQGQALRIFGLDDIVLVVRCKDCKEYTGHRWCTYFDQAILDNDFCSYGERKDNG